MPFPPSSDGSSVIHRAASELERNMVIFYNQHRYQVYTYFVMDYSRSIILIAALRMVISPAKVDTIPQLLKKYRGYETDMVAILETKYNARFPYTSTLSPALKSEAAAAKSRPQAPSVGLVASQFPPNMTWMEANMRLFFQKHAKDQIQLVRLFLLYVLLVFYYEIMRMYFAICRFLSICRSTRVVKLI